MSSYAICSSNISVILKAHIERDDKLILYKDFMFMEVMITDSSVKMEE